MKKTHGPHHGVEFFFSSNDNLDQMNNWICNQSTVSTANKRPRQLILYIILSMAMKLHVYGTRSTMYIYV